MSVLDVFSGTAFDMSSLTTAIDKLPLTPSRIGRLNLFKNMPVKTLTAQIEERHGKISILSTGARGTIGETGSRKNRVIRSFPIPHIPHNDEVVADEVQGIRAFGKETELETIAQVVNEKMEMMKMNHEITWEFHRAGAIQGIVLDADASTLFNWFTEFSISEKVIDFDLSVATTNVKAKALEVQRHIRDSIGGTPFSGIRALCGNTFFDELVNHETVVAAFERWQDGEFLRTTQTDESGFVFAGITWENYDVTVGTTDYIPATVARFFPIGAPGIFQRINAPANFIETVNTLGKPLYVKQERQKMDTGIDLHSQSNPLHICTRPAVLVKGTNT